MMKKTRSVILGSGSYLPNYNRPNSYFENSEFYNPDGSKFPSDIKEIVSKFHAITGIEERTVLNSDMHTSDMGTIASQNAIKAAGINKEGIDQIIVAHNFGDTGVENSTPNQMPTIASKIKNKLGIKNENCIPYDIVFGCPGWIQAMIQADVYIKSGYAKTCLVVGAEALSRMTDPYDRDSMIFSDGAGAVILSAVESEEEIGILQHSTISHTQNELDYLTMGTSFHNPDPNHKFIKMNGRKIYNYALSNVPRAIKSCIDKSNLDLSNISKILIHQANEKMDLAIGERLFSLYGIDKMPAEKMPMNIAKMGNNSVATVPVLFDMIMKNQLKSHSLSPSDIIIMASVGAGMSINAFSYRLP